VAKSSRRKSGRTGRGTDAETAADVQNDLPEPDESADSNADEIGADVDVDDEDLGDEDLDDADPDTDDADDSDADDDDSEDDSDSDEADEDSDDEDSDDENSDEDDLDEDDDVAADSKKDKKSRADKADKKAKARQDDRKKKAATKAAASAPAGGPVRFVRESVAELSKVVWPTRKQMITYTIVVLVFVVFLVAAIGFYDLGISKLMMLIFG